MKNLVLLIALLISLPALGSTRDNDLVEIAQDGSRGFVSFQSGLGTDPVAVVLYSAINSPVRQERYGATSKILHVREGLGLLCVSAKPGTMSVRCTVTLISGPYSMISAADQKLHFNLEGEKAAKAFELFSRPVGQTEVSFVTEDRRVEIHASAEKFSFTYLGARQP